MRLWEETELPLRYQDEESISDYYYNKLIYDYYESENQ